MGKVHGNFISVETTLIYVSFLHQRTFLWLEIKFKIIHELKNICL